MRFVSVELRAASLGLAMLVGAGVMAARSAEQTESLGMAVTVVATKSACFVDSLQLTGIVVARDEAQVRPDVEGLQVARVLAEDGASVTAGQGLAQLIRPDWLPGTPASATVTANASGVVVHGPLPVGAPASARAAPMFRIIRDGELELLAEVPQSELAKVKPGQTASIEALGASDLAGTVRFVLPDVDPLTQLGHARIQIRNKPGLRPGAFAKALIEVGRTCNPTVPLSSVLYGSQGPVVQVIRNHRIETRPVRIGLLSGIEAEIREGLSVGDSVVVRAGAFVREGDPVRAVASGMDASGSRK
jgi:multidrug efflux pump subunit AcrA (membrane-fusion protein)